VTNRGNDRRLIFLQTADYQEFLDLMKDGLTRYAVDVIAYEAMPNHYHLILRQKEQGAISAYMHRLTCLTACKFRWSTSTAGLGHVFQRRFWSRVIVGECDLVTGLRYVEANAKRRGLVARAEDWKWGSLWERLHPERGILVPAPLALPGTWVELVNQPLSDDQLSAWRS
jgi:putative transposase